MDSLTAAHEINTRWSDCLEDAEIETIPDSCPSDQEVAAIIDKHLGRKDEEESHDER